jgi:deoxyribose-phosphate aldolase
MQPQSVLARDVIRGCMLRSQLTISMPVFTLTRPELDQLIARIAMAVEDNKENFTGRGSLEGAVGLPCSEREVSGAAASVPPADLRHLARLIDHTLLRPEASRSDIEQLCREALSHGFGSVYLNPAWVSWAAEKLRGSGVKVGTVVGFPFGATLPSAKRAEAEAAIRVGAGELDMVMNVGALRSGQLDRVESDIRGVAEISHASGCILKVILENAYLSDAQKVTACRIAEQAGADYVKTSTGFGPSGAREADVRLMRETVGPAMGVKAAGGIRTLRDALCMLAAGADRLGSSASVAILAEASRRGN